MKYLICPLLGLAYLYVVLTFPILEIKQNNLICKSFYIPDYNLIYVLFEFKDKIELIPLAFSIISIFLFFIGVLFKSQILKIKRTFRLMSIPIAMFSIYGFFVFNINVFYTISEICYTFTYVYYIYFLGVMLFSAFGAFLSEIDFGTYP